MDRQAVTGRELDLRRYSAERALEICAAEVHRFVAQRVASHADAEDIAQQTLLRAWTNLGTFRGGSFRAWLFTIGRRLVVDHYRSQRRFQCLEATAAALAESEPALQTPPEAVHIACDCRARLASWVDCLTQRLPLEEQVAVLLADLHGYRDKESASALGISLASFKLLLHHARAHLQAIAGDACTLLRQSPAVLSGGESAGGGPNGHARNHAPCENACCVINCRLGIKCCRQAPKLLILREKLLAALGPKA